ncbi:MAG: hypothetical protein D6714_18850 [Bacteroidetes bacterium]|nr:MAG: hypothetical protein D6714_18850 [Bacteroidota bacterium]
MDLTLLIGIIGSLILVIGAAWPESMTDAHPVKSIKNQLFAGGALVMLAYAVLGYLNGGSVFFIILEILVVIACILMMTTFEDRLKTTLILLSGASLLIWSFYLFEEKKILLFIIGLTTVSLGYAFRAGTLRRGLALTLGSVLIAWFSYLEANWIFFWLNAFFALFSGYHLLKGMRAD